MDRPIRTLFASAVAILCHVTAVHAWTLTYGNDPPVPQEVFDNAILVAPGTSQLDMELFWSSDYLAYKFVYNEPTYFGYLAEGPYSPGTLLEAIFNRDGFMVASGVDNAWTETCWACRPRTFRYFFPRYLEPIDDRFDLDALPRGRGPFLPWDPPDSTYYVVFAVGAYGAVSNFTITFPEIPSAPVSLPASGALGLATLSALWLLGRRRDRRAS